MTVTELVREFVPPFARYRGNCRCEGLATLWEQMAETDRVESEAREYAQRFVEDLESLGRDVIFQSALDRRVQAFNLELERYCDVFAQTVRSDRIIFESNGTVIEPTAIKKGQDYTMRCRACKTQVPFVRYSGWNE